MDRTEKTSHPARSAALLASLALLAACGPGGYGGGGTPSGALPDPSPPAITSVTPAGGSPLGGALVTIAGTHFATSPAPVVTFGGKPAAVANASTPTSVTVLTPAHGAGTVDVTVTNGDGQASTFVNGFRYDAQVVDAPRVTGFSVDSSPPAGGGPFVVKGLNLQASSTVEFGGIPATVTQFSHGVPPAADLLTAIVPPSPLLPGVTDGFVSVVVRNPDGQSSTLAPFVSQDGTPWPAYFHYGPPPVATGFSPSTGRGLDVVLTGTGFSSDTAGARSGLQVLFSGPSFDILPIRTCPDAADPACPAGVVSPTPTSIVVTIPSGLLPGRYGFVVTNFDGQTTMAPGAFVVP